VSPIDAAIVRRKLGHIIATLDDLMPISRLGLAEYRARLYERKAAERLLQECIEAALDINAHVVAEVSGEVPDDYFGSFVRMGELGILPRELAVALAPSAGLRNRLVHEYESIDDAKVLSSIDVMLAQYPAYVQAVEAYLTRSGA
jgi:uncharacterized protein YutE (UPF0331/DUF86 family)